MDHSILKIVALAVVQGIAEFLPISSSGHVVVMNALLATDATESDISDINIVLHLGTLASIVVVYFSRIMRLFYDDRRLIPLLFVATVPAVMLGLPVKLWFNRLLESTLLSGCLLIVTGLVLLATRLFHATPTPTRQVGFSDAALMGLAQAAAIFPGLSRSGLTISTGMARGLSSTSAATFSFLMAIPVIGGAGVLEVRSLLADTAGKTPIDLLGLGWFVSFVVGVISLLWLIQWLNQGRFHWFAWWCIPVGLAVVIWQVVGLGT